MNCFNFVGESHQPSDDDCIRLLTAIHDEDYDAVQCWLKTDKMLPNFIYKHQSPLCNAINKGCERIVDLLLQYHCDPRQPDLSDILWMRRPIHLAACKGHLEIVKRLINQGVDINSRDNDHRTPLHWVSTYGHVELARYLLSVGACVNMAQVDGFTPMHAAACLGHDDVCRLLIQYGANINQADRDGWTALHTAVCYGYENVVKLLLEAGASTHQTTEDDENCFHIAVSSGRLEIVKLVYDKIMDVNIKNINGYTPFHLSVYYNKPAIAQFLIEKNVDMCIENNAGQSPLYLAAIREEEKLILMMLEGGYNVSHEGWLRKNSLPLIVKQSNIAELLCFMAINPLSLKELSCLCIRKLLSPMGVANRVLLLPLPVCLKEIIPFKTFHQPDL